MILYSISSSINTLDNILKDNEYVKESYRECNIVVIDRYGQKNDHLLKYDILLTDHRIFFLNNTQYTTQSSKIPIRFGGGYFLNISSIIVNAISSTNSQEEDIYLYIQLGDCEQESEQDCDDTNFIEINIHFLNNSMVYSLFNSLSETVAYEEQLENSTDSQINDEIQSDQYDCADSS